MIEKRKFKSDAFEAVHLTASGMLKVGAIDKATMRHFDESCLMADVDPFEQAVKQAKNATDDKSEAEITALVDEAVQWARSKR